MAGSLNKVFLIGRLGNDPEIKQMSNGKNVARLSLATSDTWKDKNTGEKKEKTEWHRIVIFNEGLVNVVQQYLKKGAQVYIEGQIQTTKYTDNSGLEKYSTQIVLQGYNSTLTMLGAGSSSSSKIEDNSMNQDNSSLPSDNNISSNDLDDEVPF
jgi:single-strand DNA-binding protein